MVLSSRGLGDVSMSLVVGWWPFFNILVNFFSVFSLVFSLFLCSFVLITLNVSMIFCAVILNLDVE